MLIYTYYRLSASCVRTCICAHTLNETGLCKYKVKDVINIHQGCPSYVIALQFVLLCNNIQKTCQEFNLSERCPLDKII
jgi:hypothetical protein